MANEVIYVDGTPVQYIEPVPGLNPSDLVEFGAFSTELGLSTLEVRAMAAEMQMVATQATMAGLPKVLERVRKVQKAQLTELIAKIRMRSNSLGYVRRDDVIALIAATFSQGPRS